MVPPSPAKTTGVELNSIPYDAPLTFPPATKWFIQRKTYAGMIWTTLTPAHVPGKDLTGKWVIISGGNNGIGREAALQFAAWGANLVLACRQPPKHEEHPESVVRECLERARKAGHEKNEVEWWEVDYTKLSTVEAFARRWRETGRAVDILCNNAGMGSTPRPLPFLTGDGFEMIHQVNFLSHVLLTLSLLPSLAKASEPRIVCTTSCFHYPGVWDTSYWNGRAGDNEDANLRYYQHNKLLFQIWLTELQHRLLQHEEYKKITVNGFHPGYVNSGIWELQNPDESWYTWFVQRLVKTLANYLAINSQQGSMGMLYVATSPECGPDPAVQGIGEVGGKGGGRYFNRIWEDEPMPHTKDRDCRLRVWRKVNDELKLQEKGLLDVLGLYATDL